MAAFFYFMNKEQTIDHLTYELINFLSELHDCHICKYPVGQINNRGKKRTFCTKYNVNIKYARFNCIDRCFLGFNKQEWNEIVKQYKAGKLECVIPVLKQV